MTIKNRTVTIEFTETTRPLNLQVIADGIANYITKEILNNGNENRRTEKLRKPAS